MPVGKVRYSLLTNERGGIIDDLLLTQGGYYLMLVVNASRKQVDVAHLRSQPERIAMSGFWTTLRCWRCRGRRPPPCSAGSRRPAS